MTNQVVGSRLWVRKLRLACGLTLFYYVTTHLLNHALGNISIPAMEAGMVVQKWIWQGTAGTTPNRACGSTANRDPGST
jgi:hypothetical protein